MNDHHLILGQLKDLITGRTIDDTHDERYRQKIARLLVHGKGYAKTDIVPQHPVVVRVEAKCAQVPATYIVNIDQHSAILIHYGPGSLVTRHRPALALARLAAAVQIPVVVVTNGETADILEGCSGKIVATGLENIPTKNQLLKQLQTYTWEPIPEQRAAMEARIVMAFEVDDRCVCDNSVCSWSDV